MSYSYKKLSIEILKFDCIKDRDKILMNHYLMRKENLARMNDNLPKGQFFMSTTMVMNDLGWSRSKTQRQIKEFEKLNIISPIEKGNSKKKYSIYKYLVGDIVNNTDCEMDSDTVKNTEKQQCNNSNDMDYDIDNNSEDENSKIEKKNKEINKNKLYYEIVAYLNEKSGKNFRATTNRTRSYINARLREGFVEEDFYKVIDIKCSQWRYNDMQKYLRPETLFSNKFESYINEGKNHQNPVVEDIKGNSDWDIEFDF